MFLDFRHSIDYLGTYGQLRRIYSKSGHLGVSGQAFTA